MTSRLIVAIHDGMMITAPSKDSRGGIPFFESYIYTGIALGVLVKNIKSGLVGVLGVPVAGSLGRFRNVLLASSCLIGLSAMAPTMVYAADLVIDGTAETVIGTGGGTLANPVNIGVDDVTVGNTLANSSLTISAGGAVNNTLGVIGRNAGGNGTVEVTGAASLWQNSSALFVGRVGTGKLTIANGGKVKNSIGYIGFNTSSNSTVEVTGANSLWQNTDDLAVGRSGTGKLTITNGGKVENIIGYIGLFPGSNGTVEVSGANSLLQNTSDLFVGNFGTGKLTIANGGRVEIGTGKTLHIAKDASSTGTLNIGAAAGDAATGAGSFTTDQDIQFGTGTGKIVFNHTDSNHIFDHKITGNGAVDVHSGTTTFIKDHTYTGDTRIFGGKLIVNGSLAGNVVLTGGIIAGSGTLGALTAGNGASVDPGNSIGTLNVTTLTLNAGSIYNVEVDSSGNSDLLNATGTITIASGAKVHVTPENGTDNGSTYQESTKYTIATAGGGVTGTFDAPTDDFTFLDAALSYDANNVFLTLVRNGTDFAGVAITPNQKSTTTALDALAPGTLSKAISPLGDVAARTAFDLLSGEVHSSLKGALTNNSQTTRNAVFARGGNTIDAGQAGSSSHGGPQGNNENTGQSTYDPTAGSFWMQGFGVWGNQSATTNNAKVDSRTRGVLIGGDAYVSPDWKVGLLGGYSSSDVSLKALTSSSSVESYTLGAYSSVSKGGFVFSFGADYSWHSIDTSRQVVFAGFADSLSAGYHGSSTQAYGEVSYKFEYEFGSLTPFANVAYVDQRTGSFTETGGAAALSGLSSSIGTTFTTLGARFETEIVERTKIHATLGWRHAFGGLIPGSTLAFAGGGNFQVSGMPISRDTAIFGAGVNIKLGEQTSLNLDYSGQFSNNAQEQSGNAAFVIRF